MNGNSGSPSERRRRLSHYEPTRPPPTVPVPWKNTAPSSHRDMQPGTTRHLELIRHCIKIEDARTDYEIRFLIDHSLPNPNVWPPNTLIQHEKEYPRPKYDPQWKTDIYMKRELEDFILNEDIPTAQRVDALIDRLFLCHHRYSRFDLVEKGLAMLHELKFKIQGDADWNRVWRLEYCLKQRLSCHSDHTKDTVDPRAWKQVFDLPLAQFIKNQMATQMYDEGYDIDREFSRIFGLESSHRVLRGESPVRWEGYDPNGQIDWGYYRVKSTTNGVVNGFMDTGEESTEQEEEEETQWDEDEEEEEEDDGDGDGDGSELEEISSDAFREASAVRESSSDVEITGTQGVQALNAPVRNYIEEDEASRMSSVDDHYLDEKAEKVYQGEEVYDDEEEAFREGFGNEHDEETEREQGDDASVSDSDELEIIEEHHHGDQDGEEQTWQQSSVCAIRDVVMTGDLGTEDTEDATEEDDESELEDEDKHELGEEQRVLAAENMEESDHRGSGEESGELDAVNENIETESSLPQALRIVQIRASTHESDLSSPLSSLESDEISMMDDGGAGYALQFMDAAKWALERAGGISSVKASDTSGLSSPPSNLSYPASELEESANGNDAERTDDDGILENIEDEDRRYNSNVDQELKSQSAIEVDPQLLQEPISDTQQGHEAEKTTTRHRGC